MRHHLLVVDDDPQTPFLVEEGLEREQYAVSVVPTADAALDAMKTKKFDLVLLTIHPGRYQLDAIEEIQKLDRRTPIVVLAGQGMRDAALDAVRRGAYDYLTRPYGVDEVQIVVRRALERKRLQSDLDRLSEQLASGYRRGRLSGSSPAMGEVFRQIDRVGPTDVTVLIVGESGTGKELVAESIHAQSTRRNKPFVTLNCTAIPEALLESELFGHERGAATGALTRKPGKFEQADGGTLLLDEIGDVTLATQAKIMRALQDRQIQPVGSAQTVTVDVRVLASTNRILDKAVRTGKFRDDLYFRLQGATITVPPLRDRRDEIPELAGHFLAEANVRLNKSIRRFAPDTLSALMEYAWPGNIRELRSVVERAAVVNDGEVLVLSSLPSALRPAESPVASTVRWETLTNLTLDEKVARVERAIVVDALSRAGGVQAAAARLLGVTERSVWHLVKKHRIEVSRLKARRVGS